MAIRRKIEFPFKKFQCLKIKVMDMGVVVNWWIILNAWERNYVHVLLMAFIFTFVPFLVSSKREEGGRERGEMSTVKIPPVAPSHRDDATQIYRAFKGNINNYSYSFLYILFSLPN